MLTEIVDLLQAVVWPLVILTIALIFRRPILRMFEFAASKNDPTSRNLRFKMGSFELESKLNERFKSRAEDIANEPSLEKRLEMAKEPVLVKEALQQISPEAITALSDLDRSSSYFIFDYADSIVDNTAYDQLAELGLVQAFPTYWLQGGEFGSLTAVGEALLTEVRSQSKSSPEQSAA